MSFYNNAIFWIEVGKIKPNPYQPRREFNEERLRDLADSIRQYGVLQPLVVTRVEFEKPDGGLSVEYELIAGERRLRASKLAQVQTVPVIIRSSEENEQVKLELAIIENLQREDLNAVDRAVAFKQLTEQFSLSHEQVGKKVGKSRVYVTNTLRILNLPEHMQQALREGKMAEGHTRPLLMLTDRPQEQETIFKEIYYKGMNVRDAELTSRSIAKERSRKKELKLTPEIMELEEQVAELLGTRVRVEPKTINGKVQGGKITIDFFTDDEVRKILKALQTLESSETLEEKLTAFVEKQILGEEDLKTKMEEEDRTEQFSESDTSLESENFSEEHKISNIIPEEGRPVPENVNIYGGDFPNTTQIQENSSKKDIPEDKKEEDDLYSLSDFTL
jgi:ParB family chromosome partitioning protein